MTIYGINMDGLGVDSRPAKIRRSLLGALYGFLGGFTFVAMATLIDLWLYPELPLVVNWPLALFRLPLICLGLALVGAVTCWWHEGWQGLMLGAVTASAYAVMLALFSSQVGTGMKFIVLIFILMPIAAMTLPVAYFLRWLVERHARALHLQMSMVRVTGLLVLTAVVGAGLGYFMKLSPRSIEATRYIHNYLQDLSVEENPLTEIAGVPEHAGMPYTIYPTNSTKSTEGFDIHVKYEDGYQIQCMVILYPGRIPFFTGCEVAGQ
jgi:hypothetical protein